MDWDPQACLNFNIGVLGHVDSGKTSLCMALSQISSTACFDRHPQSRERGITLDLGFSSFTLPMAAHLTNVAAASSPKQQQEYVQYTLVDCPGHASLVRTIIGGAQIIDLMMLVIDATKGIQTQTAECLVIGEITSPTDRLIVVLNKIDMLMPEETRTSQIEKLTKRVQKILSTTRFAHATTFVPVSARPAGGDIHSASAPTAIGIQQLLDTIQHETYLPNRNNANNDNSTGPFIFALDHCFTVKGQGTIITGTALSGKAAVDDVIDIITLNIQRKIKSIQRFKKPVRSIAQGDRAGICVTQFDAALLERGFACSPPGALRYASAVVCDIQRISYFKHALRSKMRLHITSGHSTVIGVITFFQPASVSFSAVKTNKVAEKENLPLLLQGAENVYVEEVPVSPASSNVAAGAISADADAVAVDDTSNTFDAQKPLFGLIVFEQPIIVANGGLIIASKLDADIHVNQCRLAFYGHILHVMPNSSSTTTTTTTINSTSATAVHDLLCQLRIFRHKHKRGTVERVADADGTCVIVRNLFKKETDLTRFRNMPVTLSTGEHGVIESSFGQSGKVKVSIVGDGDAGNRRLKPETMQKLAEKSSSGGDAAGSKQPISVTLTFRKYYGTTT